MNEKEYNLLQGNNQVMRRTRIYDNFNAIIKKSPPSRDVTGNRLKCTLLVMSLLKRIPIVYSKYTLVCLYLNRLKSKR